VNNAIWPPRRRSRSPTSRNFFPRKKAPPATRRTGLYDRMDAFLEFPRGHLAAMAQAQRLEELKRKLAEIPTPLFREARELILGKCKPESRSLVREILRSRLLANWNVL